MEGGAYASYGIITILFTGALLHGIYDIPAIKHDGWRVYTNNPPCCAQRGHGTVGARAAFETLMNEMAEELGLDHCDAPDQPSADDPLRYRSTRSVC